MYLLILFRTSELQIIQVGWGYRKIIAGELTRRSIRSARNYNPHRAVDAIILPILVCSLSVIFLSKTLFSFTSLCCRTRALSHFDVCDRGHADGIHNFSLNRKTSQHFFHSRQLHNYNQFHYLYTKTFLLVASREFRAHRSPNCTLTKYIDTNV